METFAKFEPYGLDGCQNGNRSENRPTDHHRHNTLIPEITPLLPRAHLPPHDLPIFLRVCHSPWRFLRQKALFVIRTFITFYLTFILAISLFYEITYLDYGKRYFFEAGNISLLIQVIFYWIITTWTFHHLVAPHHIRIGEDEPVGCWSKFLTLLGPPHSTREGSRRRIAFSIFYTAAVTFPFLVTAVFWLALFDITPATRAGDALRYFVLANVYGVTALIAMLEILVLNSARKQQPVSQHIEGLFVFVVVYLVWTVLGRLITGQYVYPSIDPEYAGWRAVVSKDLALLSFTSTAFLFQRNLHGVREDATSKAERDRASH